MDQHLLADDFDIFRDHCTQIFMKHKTYIALFFSGHDDLLIKTASVFFNKIADIMHCPVGTVRSRIFRARAIIEQKIAPLSL